MKISHFCLFYILILHLPFYQQLSAQMQEMGSSSPSIGHLPQNIQEIIIEGSRYQANSKAIKPLPLFSSWETGGSQVFICDTNGCGYTKNAICRKTFFSPELQVNLIREGYHILPAIGVLPYRQDAKYSLCKQNPHYQLAQSYYAPIEQIRAWGLPISLVFSQWEDQLWMDKRYRKKTGSASSIIKAQYTYLKKVQIKGNSISMGKTRSSSPTINPNGTQEVLSPSTRTTETIESVPVTDSIYVVNPCGNAQNWENLGKEFAAKTRVAYIESLYPNPPRVILLSNDEAAKLDNRHFDKTRYWGAGPNTQTDEAIIAVRNAYQKEYGAPCQLPFKEKNMIPKNTALKAMAQTRKGLNEQYTNRWLGFKRSLFNNLRSSTWKQNIRFAGYNTFNFNAYGRLSNWRDYFSVIRPRDYHRKLAFWNGAAPAYYAGFNKDNRLASLQVEAMNNKMLLDEIMDVRPNEEFWNELSISPDDGAKKNEIEWYIPERYQGTAQFGMWLMRPRVVREYTGHTVDMDKNNREAYFYTLLEAVERVYDSPILKRFWREGKLIKNVANEHPYKLNPHRDYQHLKRWYLLNVPNFNPPHKALFNGKPSYYTKINVFAIALEIETEEGSREWLIYAHAPNGTIEGEITIQIPILAANEEIIDELSIRVPIVEQAGSFYHVQRQSWGEYEAISVGY